MSFVNYVARQIDRKIVYFGPSLSGKTTNLRWIHEHIPAGRDGRMISVPGERSSPLFFDFLSVGLGSYLGFNVRLHLYSVPGQTEGRASRMRMLRGADGIVLVADSDRQRLADNLEALKELQESLHQQGRDLLSVPYLLQLNKRDLATALPLDSLKSVLVLNGEPVIEAVASQGAGVYETLHEVGRLVLAQVKPS